MKPSPSLRILTRLPEAADRFRGFCGKWHPKFRLCLQLLFLIVFLFLVVNTFKQSPYSFLLDLDLDRVEVIVGADTVIPITVDQQLTGIVSAETIPLRLLSRDPEYLPTEGRLKVSTGARVVVDRKPMGEVVIQVEAERKNNLPGQMRLIIDPRHGDDESEEYFVSRIILTYKQSAERQARGKIFLLSFSGTMRTIDPMRDSGGSSPPIIHSGNIFLTGKTIVGQNFFEVSPILVHPGDGITFKGIRDINGFLTVNDENHEELHLVVIGQLTEENREGQILINRLGHSPISIQVNFWQKIMNDKVLSFMWAALFFAFPFVFGFY